MALRSRELLKVPEKGLKPLAEMAIHSGQLPAFAAIIVRPLVSPLWLESLVSSHLACILPIHR